MNVIDCRLLVNTLVELKQPAGHSAIRPCRSVREFEVVRLTQKVTRHSERTPQEINSKTTPSSQNNGPVNYAEAKNLHWKAPLCVWGDSSLINPKKKSR
jgi:hypothetical protein